MVYNARPMLCAAAMLLASCGGGGSVATASPAAPVSAAPAPSPAHHLAATLVATQLAVGTDRFPIGVSDRSTPVTDAAVHVRVFVNVNGASTLKGEADAPYRGDGLQGHGLYVASFTFDAVGLWQAQLTIRLPDGTQGAEALQFGVRRVTEVPMVGQPAPRSRNQTLADVPDASYIDSGQPPDDMHTISLADAIAQHRPALVVFATPAFCTSATCGPQISAVQALEPAYRDRLAFIHVEVYTDIKPDPGQRRLSPVMAEWHLQTEPWVFLVDRAGNVGAVFEGPTATSELAPAVDHLLATG